MTEELLHQAFDSALAYYCFSIVIITLSAVFCIHTCIKEGGSKEGDKYAALGILLIVLGIWTLFDTTIPLTQEYRNQDILVVEGIYEKAKSQSGGRYSRAIGLETVSIQTEQETIVLTTYPWNDGEFPEGSFPAVAYYTPGTEFLLHIEIQK